MKIFSIAQILQAMVWREAHEQTHKPWKSENKNMSKSGRHLIHAAKKETLSKLPYIGMNNMKKRVSFKCKEKET